MESEKKFKRRSIFIKGSFQLKYAAVVMSLFAVSALFVWWETYQSFNDLLSRGAITDPGIMLALKQTGRVIFFKLLIAQALVFLMAILLSHFIAGPAFRIEKSLGILKAGDLTHRIKLRKLDELVNLADAFNDTVASLQSKVGQDREKLTTIANEMDKVLSQKGSLDKEQTNSIAERLKETTKGFTI